MSLRSIPPGPPGGRGRGGGVPYRQAGLFASVSESDRKRVLGSGRRRSLPAKAPLYYQGDRVKSLCIIESGVVRTFYTNLDGHEFTIGFWGAGDIVGAPDLSGAGRRALSAVAQTQATIVELASDSLEGLCAEVPAFAVNLIRVLSFKVRWVSLAAANLSTKSAATRLDQLLLALSEISDDRLDDHRVRLGRIYTQSNLASMVGCSRQWLNVQLGELRSRGAVLPGGGGRRLVVDVARLREPRS